MYHSDSFTLVSANDIYVKGCGFLYKCTHIYTWICTNNDRPRCEILTKFWAYYFTWMLQYSMVPIAMLGIYLGEINSCPPKICAQIFIEI